MPYQCLCVRARGSESVLSHILTFLLNSYFFMKIKYIKYFISTFQKLCQVGLPIFFFNNKRRNFRNNLRLYCAVGDDYDEDDDLVYR